MDRKKFIKRTLGAIGAFTIVPRHVLGGNGYTAPSDQLTRAIIGVGGMGRGHLRYPGARLVALCDVEQLHLDRALGMVERGVRSYSDYREVLEQEDRKSTRLNSSHVAISYAVFCLKKKKET